MGYIPYILCLLAFSLSAQSPVPPTDVPQPASIEVNSQLQIKQASVSVPYRLPIPSQISSLVEVDIKGSGCEIVDTMPGETRGSFIEIPVDS